MISLCVKPLNKRLGPVVKEDDEVLVSNVSRSFVDFVD